MTLGAAATDRAVDLNSDVGEAYGAFAGGPDEELMPMLSSVNVACGGHAGDPSTMRRTCRTAVRHGCVIGAQVSYPDLVGFGRRFIDMAPDDLAATVIAQVGALDAIARAEGTRVAYVKPHGALYHAVVQHEGHAAAVVEALVALGRLPLLAMSISVAATRCAAAGVPFVAEGFIDRAYAGDGRLVPRGVPGALVVDPQVAVRQAIRLLDLGVRSLCVHSDTAGAVSLLAAVHDGVRAAGWAVTAFCGER